jgi:alcohol dehydrogenase
MPILSEQTLMITPPPTLIFGVDCINELPEQIKALGKSSAFIVTDKGLMKAGIVDQVTAILSDAGIGFSIFDGVEPNPTTDNIKQGSVMLRDAGDVAVVAIGGGSAMDAAKGIALHAVNPGPVVNLDYRVDPKKPGQPIIAIPTTSGTGSETNTYGVITNLENHRKFYVGDTSVQPKVAILDPKLTLGLPPSATAATGMDVLTHAIESLSSRNSNEFADGIDLHVIGMVAKWLPRAVSDGSDLEARAQMLLAAHIVGVAYRSGTGFGVVHAIGHSIGGRLGTPHGMALSILLPDVLRFNLPVCAEKYAQVAFAMGVGDTAKSAEANANAAIDAIQKLAETVGMYKKLRDVGCTPELVPILVRDSLDDVVIYNAPRQPSADDVRDLILAVM